ncbi:hypothetical protein [Roseicyclus sp.]|uniref:hypothetical protein n=1 Tax=Roseicyclus sp. TaxID=1914329 RepID=UPI003FA120B8
MGRILTGILGLVVGLALGTVFGGGMIAGTATGVGIATGLSAGICSTVTAARGAGLLDEDQIGEVLSRAAAELGGTVEAGQLVGSVAQCEEVMANLRAAAAAE